MKRWLLGSVCFVAGLLVVPIAAFVYLDYGRPPVAVADASFPFERQIVRGPLHTRMAREMAKEPGPADAAGLLAGAHIYKEHCAFCHGLPDQSTEIGKSMFPTAPQLWAKHRNGVVGVSDDPVGETHWRVKNGIRLTGMPSYQKLLSEPQIWQVSQLLASAASPLPEDVRAVLAAKY